MSFQLSLVDRILVRQVYLQQEQTPAILQKTMSNLQLRQICGCQSPATVSVQWSFLL